MIQSIRYKTNYIKNGLISGRLFLIIQIILVVCCLLFVVSSAKATVLYLEPSSGEYKFGDTFFIKIRIDTEGECINVVKADLIFTRSILEAVDFSKGESILTLWLEEPTIIKEEGKISFIGGVPGSYCGRVPGDPGESNLLGKIIFRVPSMIVGELGEEKAEIRFLDSSQVLLSDGSGTEAELSTQGAELAVVSKSESSKEEWKEEVERDKLSPEPFELVIHYEEGKYFVIFNTTDKQTGIDHYEISETKGTEQEKWTVAQNPYLLQDQTLQSIIKVKAVDEAGNETIAEYIPPALEANFPFWKWILIFVLFFVAVGWIIIKKSKKNKSKPIDF